MFNHKIRQILTEELLMEAASLEKIVGALRKNNPKFRRVEILIIKRLIMADPTAVENDRGQFVGKYWKWIYNQYKQGNIHLGDIPELRAALNTYNINKSRINKPIESYNTLDELVREIAQYDDNFKAGRTISKGEQELEKVYEDQYVVVYIPHTWEAARKIGGDTRWCTASSSGDHYFNMYKNNYGGEYYDIIRKSDGAKFQLHPESNQFMDREDHETNFASVFNTKKEANGLISFLESRGKNVDKWKPKIWFDEVEEKLASGIYPERIFDNLFGKREGFTRVELNGKYNWISDYNKLLSPGQWFDDAWGFANGFAKCELGKMLNFMTKEGKILSPGQWFKFAFEFENGAACVSFGRGEWNYIRTDGELLCQGETFSDVFPFFNGFGRVNKNGKWNFVKYDGELLSPNQWFDMAYDFNKQWGGAKVRVGDKIFRLDAEGNLHRLEVRSSGVWQQS